MINTQEDVKNIQATSNGYKAVINGQQKNLERDNPDDADDIAVIDFMTINKPRD